MTVIIQSPIRTILACLMLLFCFGYGSYHLFAQDSGALSRLAPVIRVFDPDKNESTVASLLVDPKSTDMKVLLGLDPSRRPPALQLRIVEYSYPGKSYSRPQAVAFILVPLGRHKSPPDFSLTMDGALLHQGEAVLREICCVEAGGKSQTTQQIVVTVPIEMFEQMTKGKKIELKLNSESGQYSFKLNDYQKKCLAALAETIK
ncbi:MAG TPA: hypothetical protein VJS44_08940 [Pyrinomonadaceae bacterium]|nr:hypothetical protein [Pyrinomonadaceae bacterium]